MYNTRSYIYQGCKIISSVDKEKVQNYYDIIKVLASQTCKQ